MLAKPLMFVVISFLIVALIHSSFSTFNVYAVDQDPKFGLSETCGATTTHPGDGILQKSCCWAGIIPGKLPPNNKANFCQTCRFYVERFSLDCKPPVQQG